MFGPQLKRGRPMRFSLLTLPVALRAPGRPGPFPLETATGFHPTNALGFNLHHPLVPPVSISLQAARKPLWVFRTSHRGHGTFPQAPRVPQTFHVPPASRDGKARGDPGARPLAAAHTPPTSASRPDSSSNARSRPFAAEAAAQLPGAAGGSRGRGGTGELLAPPAAGPGGGEAGPRPAAGGAAALRSLARGGRGGPGPGPEPEPPPVGRARGGGEEGGGSVAEPGVSARLSERPGRRLAEEPVKARGGSEAAGRAAGQGRAAAAAGLRGRCEGKGGRPGAGSWLVSVRGCLPAIAAPAGGREGGGSARRAARAAAHPARRREVAAGPRGAADPGLEPGSGRAAGPPPRGCGVRPGGRGGLASQVEAPPRPAAAPLPPRPPRGGTGRGRRRSANLAPGGAGLPRVRLGRWRAGRTRGAARSAAGSVRRRPPALLPWLCPAEGRLRPSPPLPPFLARSVAFRRLPTPPFPARGLPEPLARGGSGGRAARRGAAGPGLGAAGVVNQATG